MSGNTPKSRILTIIVVYNASKWLRTCLQSTQDSEYKTDVVVVDNNSTDNSREITREFPEVRLVELEENIGFGRANNVGMEMAMDEGYDHVFLLNGDAYYHPDCLGKLIEQVDSQPDLGILSPVHLNGDSSKLDFRFELYLQKGNCPGFISDDYLKQLKPLYEIGFVNAAAWLIPVKTIKKVGFLDPLFFIYGEDANYLMRVRHHGMKTYICPGAHIRHDREERKGKLNYFSRKHEVRSQLLQFYLSLAAGFGSRTKQIMMYGGHALKNGFFWVYLTTMIKMLGERGRINKHRKLYEKGLFEL